MQISRCFIPLGEKDEIKDTDMQKRKTRALLLVGIFVIAMAQIVNHYAVLPDPIHGAFMGAGIGLMALSLIRGKFSAASKA